jgi:hypothetical protein
MYLFCNSRIHVITLYSSHVCVYYAPMLRCWHLVWILVGIDHPCLGVGCHKTTRTVFVSLASKLVAMISDGLGSKLAATIFSSLTSKLVVTVSPGLASKLAVDFLVEPQNQGGGGFPGLDLKIGNSGLVI